MAGKRPQGKSAESPEFSEWYFFEYASDLEEWSKLGASPPEHIQEDAQMQEEIKRWRQLPERERRKRLREQRPSRQSLYASAKQLALQAVAEAQQEQRELEKEKALLIRQMNDGDTQRGELKRQLTSLERKIQLAKGKEEHYQKDVKEFEEKLQRLSDQQDEESRKYIDEAMRCGYVQARLIKSVFSGPPGVGKTSLKFLLLGKPPPGLRTSTPCAERPVRVRVVSGTRIQLYIGGWKVVDEQELLGMLSGAIPILCDNLTEGQVEFIESLFQRNTEEEATPDQEPAASQADQGTPSTQDEVPLSTSAEAIDLAISSLLDQLTKAISGGGENVSRELIDSDWIHIIDSGGQPQFHDLLPIFIHNTCSTIFVQRLNESLNDYPIVEYFKAGELVGTPYPSLLTNIQILMCMIRSLQSRPTEGKNSMIAIVGTHKDKEHECLSETRAEKNKTLFDLLHSAFPNDLVLYNKGLNEPIFPVNTKNPGEEERQIATVLRQAIESSAPDAVRIPIMWYILELLLRRLASILGRRVLSTKECLEIAHKLNISTEAFHVALKYFDDLNICLYYPAMLPSVLFTDPQIPVDKLSELVEHRHRLHKAREGNGNHAMSEAVVTSKWLKFRDQGVVTLEFLQQFPEHYVPGLFTAADFLTLLQHLLILAPISRDEYFMPSLLEMVADEELDKHRVCTGAVAPLLLCFPNGWPRAGVFPCLATFLMSRCQWEVLLPPSGTPILIARNIIKFRLPGCPCTVTLVDSFAYFEVHVKAPSSVCRRVCPTIHDAIISGIDAATKTLRYNNAKPFEAFFCPHSNSDSGHTSSNQPVHPHHRATLSDDQEYWLCSMDADLYGELAEREKLWLKSETTTSGISKPTEKQLMEQLYHTVADKWQPIGTYLEIPQAQLSAINERCRGDPHMCLMAVLTEKWLPRVNPPPTWQELAAAIEFIGRPDVAKILRQL